MFMHIIECKTCMGICSSIPEMRRTSRSSCKKLVNDLFQCSPICFIVPSCKLACLFVNKLVLACKCLYPWIGIIVFEKRQDMVAYFTRAVPHPAGFHRALHNRSTADVDLGLHVKPNNSLASVDEDMYEVEQLVFSQRGKVCFRFSTAPN